MDDRIPQYLRRIVQKLDFLAIPNLSYLIGGLAILAFLATQMFGIDISRLYFVPQLILLGEYSRLFAFPLETGSHPIWLLLFVYVTYIIVGGLENSWGPGPLTVYTILGYLSVMAGGFVTMTPVSIWYYVMINLTMAFGTTFPDIEFLIFFVIPVKVKYLAMLSGGFLLFQFVVGSMGTKVFLLFAMLPYLLFFSPYLYKTARMRYQVRKNRQRHDKDMWK